jgi:hypothetical protein
MERPVGATHLPGPLIVQDVLPLLVVLQQVGLEQVEWDAHVLTKSAQLLLVRTVFACCAAQRT